MQIKAELRENIAEIPSAIYYNRDLYDPEIGVEYISREETAEKGILKLDNKIIATVGDHGIVTNIFFNDRYDLLIRNIFTVLEVELHRFGSAWVGYPSPDSIKPTYKTIPHRTESEIYPAPSPAPRNYSITTTSTISTTPPTHADTWTGIFTSIMGSGNFITGYNTYGQLHLNNYSPQSRSARRNPTRDISPRIKHNPAPPKNPFLARAIERGASQMSINKLVRTGKIK